MEAYERPAQDQGKYSTMSAAKKTANLAHNPVIVGKNIMAIEPEPTYDWLPQGHPLAQGEQIVARYQFGHWTSVPLQD